MKRAARWFDQPTRWRGKARFFGGAFALPFLAGGVAVLMAISLMPIAGWLRAKDWIETPATVLTARLAEVSDSDGTTNRVEVRYRYYFAGRDYESTRFDFTTGSTNIGVDAMLAAVRRLESNPETRCWVNPAQPAEAVLERGFPTGAILGIFFCAPFLLVGVLGVGGACFGPRLVRAYREHRSALVHRWIREEKLPWRKTLSDDVCADPETALIVARDERIVVAAAASALCIFWNGIVAVFLCVLLIEWWTGGEASLFLALFLIPFEIVGACLLWWTCLTWWMVRRPAWLALIAPVPGIGGGEVDVAIGFSDPTAALRAHVVRFVGLHAPGDSESDRPQLSLRRQLGFWRGAPGKRGRSKHEELIASVSLELGAVAASLRFSLPSLHAPEPVGAKNRLRCWFLELEDIGGFVESHLISSD